METDSYDQQLILANQKKRCNLKVHPCYEKLWDLYPARKRGPRHKVVGQSGLGDHETYFHTIGSNIIWSIPIQDLIFSERGTRIIAGMSPDDAMRTGMEYARYSDNEARKEIRRRRNHE